jgi:capsid protein
MWAAPGWGNARLKHRIEASFRGGLSTRLSESWEQANGLRWGNPSSRQQQRSGRDRAYNAYENNPVAKTLVDTETDNVIGGGLNYHPTSSDPEWNKEAKDRYYQWLETCDLRQLRSGADLQRDIWRQSRIAGDIGWILINNDSGGIIDSKIQLVPAENIRTPDSNPFNPQLIDGIQFDQYSAPQSFWVLDYNEYGKRSFTSIPQRDFVYLPHFDRLDQARGVTCYMTIFDLLANLDRYVDSVALAAYMGTIFGLIFKQENSGKQLSGLDTLLNSQGVAQRAVTLEKGMVKYVGEKGEVVQVDAKQPMQQTPDFIRQMLRLLGMPFGMALEVFAKDMSSCNFASARIGLLPFYRLCRTNATCTFGPRWSRTIRWWLSREAQRAKGDPKRWINVFPADYWNHKLLCNEWAYTDPVSDVQGRMLERDAGFTSDQKVITEGGDDPDEVLTQRFEWAKKTKQMPAAKSSMTRDVDMRLDEGDKQFKRDVVKAFLADGTVNDIIYNVTDIPSLLDSVGLARDPSLDDLKGDGIPFLPVVAVPGPLVTGATIQDPQGAIVGGDVEIEAPPEDAGTASKESDAAAADAKQANMHAETMAAIALAASKPAAPITVNNNIPKDMNIPAPNVTVQAPEVKVNVQPPAVTVNVPEQPAPRVTVNVPEPKPRKIKRDNKGRIEGIE